MSSYKIGQTVPAVALTLKLKSGTVIANIPAPVLFNKAKLVRAEIIQLVCITKKPTRYIHNKGGGTSSYAFEELESGEVFNNQYPEAIPFEISRWARFSFTRNGNGVGTTNYVDLYRYLSALRTSIAKIEYYDGFKTKKNKDSNVPSLLKTRLAIYEALCKQASNQLNVKLTERRVVDDKGVYRLSDWRVSAIRL